MKSGHIHNVTPSPSWEPLTFSFVFAFFFRVENRRRSAAELFHSKIIRSKWSYVWRTHSRTTYFNSVLKWWQLFRWNFAIAYFLFINDNYENIDSEHSTLISSFGYVQETTRRVSFNSNLVDLLSHLSSASALYIGNYTQLPRPFGEIGNGEWNDRRSWFCEIVENFIEMI